MELTKVTLPPVNQECLENRITGSAQCSSDLNEQVGNPVGACGEGPHALKKVVGAGLYDLTYNTEGSIPRALQSPAYETLKAFQMSGSETGELLDLWMEDQAHPREAVCHWVVDNFDRLQNFIPRTFPRVILDEHEQAASSSSSSLQQPLSFTATLLASLAITVVLLTAVFTYARRDRPIMQYAQLEFLTLLLSGLTSVSVGSLLLSFPPTDGLCVAAVWLTNVGYTLELVPLIVKMGAFYRLMKASRRLRHVEMSRQSLFWAVLLLSGVIIIFLIAWTVLDPPQERMEYELSDKLTDAGEGIVHRGYFCESEAPGWIVASVTWHLLLLVVATIQAFQTRTIRREVNESHTLAIMIYSHFMFVCLRLGTLFLEGHLSESDMMQMRSIIFSLDSLLAVTLYFVPKFFSDDSTFEKREEIIESQTVKQLRMLAAIATAQHERQINRMERMDRAESGGGANQVRQEDKERRLSLPPEDFKAHLQDVNVVSMTATKPSTEEDNSTSHRCRHCGKSD
jgi:hypothetical protein